MTEETTTPDEISGDNTPVAAGDEHANVQPEPLAMTAAPEPAARSDRKALLFEVLLVLVLLFGGYLRMVGLNWDENKHLHPDERFLTMVESSLTPIEQPGDYFDTANSTLNPHNTGHGFFVYGTVPIFITRYTAEGIKIIKQDWLESEVAWQQSFAAWAAGTDDAPGLLAQFGADYNQVYLVGRLLNAMADLLSVFMIYLIGRQLYDRRVGLLAAAFSAVTVAYIQQAHFFTVDAMANLFVVVALYFAARVWATDISQGKVPLRYFALFGVAFGLAVASRINTVPLALVVALAGFVIIRRSNEDYDISRKVVIGLVLAGVISILTFRLGQPYAFEGPGFFNIGLNEQWLSNMRSVGAQVSGDVDFPPNHQWTDRPAYIFPLQNMIGYGMGFALGITVWLGVLWALWRSLRRPGDWERHLIPLVWTLIYFAWQGQQWVKPIRYFLPIYPTLILLGAAMLVALWDWSAAHRQRQTFAPVATGIIGLVLIGATVWGFAFSRIYTRPVTRVSATKWILENVPGPLNLKITLEDGSIFSQPLPMPGGYTYSGDARHSLTFIARESGTINEVVVGYLSEPLPDPELETFSLTLGLDPSGETFISQAGFSGDLAANGAARGQSLTLTLDRPFTVAANQTYYLTSWVTPDSGPVKIAGSILINESTWDDGLPLPYDGYDPFGGLYTGNSLELYWDDNQDKRESMLDSLDRGDYIIISSDRQYNSIPRLPTRYPMTIAYYQALFSGKLGFELAARFESAPNLGPWVLSDQDAQDPFVVYGDEDPPLFAFPDVEEPFTVYDHPKVFIFKKSADYSPENARAILEAVDLSQVIWMNPYQATVAPTALMLPDELEAIQRAGGTWSAMFDADGLLNRFEPLGVLAWLTLAWLIGTALFPITFVALHGLPDRGYAFAKLVGILLVSWGIWVLASVRVLPNTGWATWLVFGGWIALAALLYRRNREAIDTWVRQNRRYILVVEGLTLGLFLLFLFIRWYNPDLWHPSYGGEKPMNFSYFNAVLKSTYFPPYDPWLAGGYINYYYYGYVLVGVLTKMLGIVPAFAYNLALPLLFAFTGMGAFGVAYNLIAAGKRYMTSSGNAILAGVVAMTLAVLLGNLGQFEVILRGLSLVGADIQTLFDSGFFADLQRAVVGLYRVVAENADIPIGTGQWYWNATRIIPTPAGETQPITEFPFFTFLYADLHAHLIAMPLTLLVMGWASSIVLSANDIKGRLQQAAQWFLGGLAIGALAPTNTWDFPTYLVLGIVAVGYAQLRKHRAVNRDMLVGLAWRVALLVALSRLLFGPYNTWYGPGYTSAEIWEGSTTGVTAFLKVHGLFLFILVPFLLSETRRWMQIVPISILRERASIITSTVAGLTLLIVAVTAGLLLRFDVFIAPLVVPLIAWTGLLMIWPHQAPERRAVLALLGLGLTLTLTVEIIRLSGDIGRMNTVFKFYVQVWLLFSVAAGAALAWVWRQRSTWKPVNRDLWLAGLALLGFIAALYPLSAAPAKMRDRMEADAPRTLNGMDYMLYATYADQGRSIPLADDYDAIRWMQDNVAGSPVIVEASVVEYHWGSRYTINTGLPSVVGWNWHQRQQRAVTPGTLVSDRVDEVRDFYTTPSTGTARDFLQRYDVQYIIVGEYERAYYAPDPANNSGLAKFDTMVASGALELAYSNPTTMIYRVSDLTQASLP